MIRAGAAAGQARAGIVLLHGRGGSAADILGLLAHAGPEGVTAVAPEAPGRSWWPTSFLAPAATLAPHLDRALAAVREAVAVLEAEGLARGQIVLAGFSQGACLALEAFARDGAGLRGVVAMSGGLIGTADTGAADPALYGHADKVLAYPGRRDGARVWLSVHMQDPHIPLKRVRDSAAALAAMGAAVDCHVAPGAGHGVFPQDIEALRRAQA
jgi:predicted esterase